MLRDGSALRQMLDDRISKGGFAIALSGGGHRATLATLGALIAIVDRGLGSKVIQVASVSGGSITNAFVAQRGQLERLGPGQLDNIATELAITIIRKGVLTPGWIALLLLGPIVLGIAAGMAFRAFIAPWTWFALMVGVVLTLASLIGRGLLIEWLLDRRYFRSGASAKRRRHGSRARLASLSGRQVDHVFCMTDLALGLPVYASSQHGGFIWRRLRPERIAESDGLPFQTFDAGQLSIAEVVRASAAFPGIPPRRMPIPPDPVVKIVAETPQVAFLADGGLWNNLGSQVLREDGFIGSYATWDDGVLRPYGTAPNMPLLCFNGSAPLRPTQSWAFKIPVIALLKSLLQTTEILNANTVLPRIAAMRRAFDRRVWNGRRPDHHDPADLLVDLRITEEIARDYLFGTWGVDDIRLSDPVVKEWEKSVLLRVRNAWKYASESSATDHLTYIFGRPEPQGSFPVCGLANIDDWDALRKSLVWKQLIKNEGAGEVIASTTLGRIKPALARRLIARGYLNTYLVSLFLAPLSDGDLDRLGMLSERLDKIVGSGPARTPASADNQEAGVRAH